MVPPSCLSSLNLAASVFVRPDPVKQGDKEDRQRLAARQELARAYAMTAMELILDNRAMPPEVVLTMPLFLVEQLAERPFPEMAQDKEKREDLFLLVEEGLVRVRLGDRDDHDQSPQRWGPEGAAGVHAGFRPIRTLLFNLSEAVRSAVANDPKPPPQQPPPR